MIARQLVITKDFIVDEQTGFGICAGTELGRFDENGVYICAPSVEEVMNEYLARGLRIPGEFGPVRDAVAAKIAQLNSAL